MFLKGEKVRATYEAVASCIGVPPQSMGEQLGDRGPDVSWVVSSANGLPTGYRPGEMDKDLFVRDEVIRTKKELLERIVEWR